MPPDRLWTIGELAERAGVTVKTVRYYSDRGLLPEARRSSGGHRRYGPAALDRLRTIRSLRGLGLAVPDVHRVLDEDDRASAAGADAAADVLDGLIAGQLREVGAGLAALRWREAALQALQDCGPGERAERLLLVGALPSPPSTAAMARFWRRWLPPRMPARLVSAILDGTIPQLPEAPTPAQALAFARLHALVSGSCDGAGKISGKASGTSPGDGRDPTQPAAHRPEEGYRPAVLYDGLIEAYGLAAPHLRAGRRPQEGEALDCFVAAYARSRGARDTPAFRRRLGGVLGADPRIDRYWQLAGELFGPAEPTPGSTHDWLLAALDGATAEAA
ncbi:MerR family transcriptional regulator [Streptomyces sp. NPDC008079]|uniref:MerR family transcriptional regulator n=1 Tax=Streptomyces sp. NPDC008079 TaxID=3364806 RepID=UPI0036E4186F